jgi:hypothetical protein
MKVHARLRSLAGKCPAAALALVRALIHPLTIGFVLILLGCCVLVGGVFILFGQGWALIAGGVFAIAAGVLLVRGVSYVQKPDHAA